MRTARRKTVRVAYLGAEGYGPTKTEAKQAAAVVIERAMTSTYTPVVLCWRGMIGLLWCDRGCYSYTVKPTDTLTRTGEQSLYGTCIAGEDRKAALESLRSHLGQMGWTPGDGKTVPLIMKGCSDSKQADLVSWEQWQLAAHHAKNALGLTGNALHAWACDHQAEF